METSLLRKIEPRLFFDVALSKGLRPDGRDINQQRPKYISNGGICNAESSCLVNLGSTSVVCGVKLEVAQRSAVTKDTGYLNINVHVRRLCWDVRTWSKFDTVSSSLSTHLSDIIQRSHCVDMAALVIPETELAFVLHADIVILEHDGSLLDACLAALTSALEQVRLPTVTIDNGLIKAGWKDNANPALGLRSRPHCTTFAEVCGHILMDPTREEEELATSCFTICFADSIDNSNMCVLKDGEASIDMSDIMECVELARRRPKEQHA